MVPIHYWRRILKEVFLVVYNLWVIVRACNKYNIYQNGWHGDIGHVGLFPLGCNCMREDLNGESSANVCVTGSVGLHGRRGLPNVSSLSTFDSLEHRDLVLRHIDKVATPDNSVTTLYIRTPQGFVFEAASQRIIGDELWAPRRRGILLSSTPVAEWQHEFRKCQFPTWEILLVSISKISLGSFKNPNVWNLQLTFLLLNV